MCSWVAHDILQLDYKHDERIIGDRSIPNNATTKALEALVDAINSIDVWLQLFLKTFNSRCDEYINAMKDMFKQIPQTV